MEEGSRLLRGAGLGLRRPFLEAIAENPPGGVDFYEVAPENWMHVGGRNGRLFRSLTERFPFVCHGLSLSLGGPTDLDAAFLAELKAFLDLHRVRLYSEHLSYCSDGGHLYDLLPIPFTAEAVVYVARRIRHVQDVLERRIAIENISYYAAPGREMEEIEFLNAVLEEADCDFLLDLNNIYVNGINHGYDPLDFLSAIPPARIAYAHIAGHLVQAPDFLIDTHGSAVIDPVWNLLETTYHRFGRFPTLLERDFNIPPLEDLLQEVARIRSLQERFAGNDKIVRDNFAPRSRSRGDEPQGWGGPLGRTECGPQGEPQGRGEHFGPCSGPQLPSPQWVSKGEGFLGSLLPLGEGVGLRNGGESQGEDEHKVATR
jgi:uncharacterized protein (UPF0276 family)